MRDAAEGMLKTFNILIGFQILPIRTLKFIVNGRLSLLPDNLGSDLTSTLFPYGKKSNIKQEMDNISISLIF